MDSPNQLLRTARLRPKPSWGQNFLSDPQVLQRIVDALAPRPGETVLELGAGLGHLTRALVETGAQVTAVEREREMVRILEALAFPNLRILPANAADLDFATAAGARPVALVGNLPFHLTSPILFQMIAQWSSLSRAVVTVQKEVAQRLAAPPGGRTYGILSVLLGLFFEIENLFELGPELFYPPPKVRSAVVRLTARPRPLAEVSSEERFQRLVKAAFGQRRKTLLNALKSAAIATGERLREALERAGVEPTRRAETLSIEEFAALERALAAGSSDG